MKILIIGGGAREHAICWAIAKSPLKPKIYCAPGNAGISQIAENVPIKVEDDKALVEFAKTNQMDFVVVSPDGPLVAGLVDKMQAAGLKTFGPSAAAARLEGSKAFTKDLCRRYNIPTARYSRFTDLRKAEAFISNMIPPIVIKADGLALGKGVMIAESAADAFAAAARLMPISGEIIVEEFLHGQELSLFAFVAGDQTLFFTTAQDHKRAFDGDHGPNTGGMGAYSPAPFVTQILQQEIMERIINPTARAMVEMGAPFYGMLYAGLMLTDKGPYLIEYNARFGDPECQVMLPRLKTDFLSVLQAVAGRNLNGIKLEWHSTYTLGVVYAAKGYPDAPQKGTVIRNLEKAAEKSLVFHYSTKYQGNDLIADGGRVLTIVGQASSLEAAAAQAYGAIQQIDWEGGFYRRDIGWRALGPANKSARA